MSTAPRILRTFFALRVIQVIAALYLLGVYAYFTDALSASPAHPNSEPLKPLILSVLLTVYSSTLALFAYATPLKRLLARRYFALFSVLDAGFFGALIWCAVEMRSSGGCLLWMMSAAELAAGAFFADDSAMGALVRSCRLDNTGYAAVVLALVSFVFTGLASAMLTLFFKKEEAKEGSIRSGKESMGSSSGEENGHV